MSVSISAKEVNELRQKTGSGMMDCKKALVEAGGDFDKAIDILRKKGQKVSAARSNRETSEGIVIYKLSPNEDKASILSFTCEKIETILIGALIVSISYLTFPSTSKTFTI